MEVGRWTSLQLLRPIRRDHFSMSLSVVSLPGETPQVDVVLCFSRGREKRSPRCPFSLWEKVPAGRMRAVFSVIKHPQCHTQSIAKQSVSPLKRRGRNTAEHDSRAPFPNYAIGDSIRQNTIIGPTPHNPR